MNLKTEQQKNKKKTRNPFKYFVFDFVKWTGALPIFIWLRLKTIYENKNAKKKIKGGALVCANHMSFKDPLVLHTKLWYRRLHMVATKEIFSNKLADWFFTKALCIKIDRENIGVNSFKEIITRLKDNKVVAIFPEGHINHNTGTLDFFKSGVILMAMQGNVPIVPMLIIKKEKWWQRQKIVVGEPINLPNDRMNLMQINEYSELLRKKEMELLEIYEKRKKRK